MSMEQSKAQAIREIYQQAGGNMGLNRLARLSIEAGVWSEEDQHNLLFATIRSRCKSAIKSLDHNGLPIAGEAKSLTIDGEKVWLQLDLWDYEDAVHNLAIRIKSEWQDQVAIEKLSDWTKTKFGTVPPIPRLDFPDDEPMWWNDDVTPDDDNDPDDDQDPTNQDNS